MRNWEGSTVRRDAQTVCCRHCHALIGQPCTGLDGEPLQAFPAHTKRITDAQKTLNGAQHVSQPQETASQHDYEARQ